MIEFTFFFHRRPDGGHLVQEFSSSGVWMECLYFMYFMGWRDSRVDGGGGGGGGGGG